MKIPLLFISAAILSLAIAAHALVGDSPKTRTPVPRDASLTVDLAIEPSAATDGSSHARATITVTNTGTAPLLVQSPENRLALTFIVSDAHGNFVPPPSAVSPTPPSRNRN
jgi:hypothetical protein